jgi:hypothetical protein
LSNDHTDRLVQNMFRISLKNLVAIAIAALSIAACGEDSGSSATAPTAKPAGKVSAATSPGKPSAPISIDYEVLGKPIIGLPVAINVQVRATRDGLGPVSLSYSINDESALLFQEGQVVQIEIPNLQEASMQQLAVVPQREGRLYINVAAEVQTPGGSMIKSMAIPIQVGSAPLPSKSNGEVKEGPDGETVQSMPAEVN